MGRGRSEPHQDVLKGPIMGYFLLWVESLCLGLLLMATIWPACAAAVPVGAGRDRVRACAAIHAACVADVCPGLGEFRFPHEFGVAQPPGGFDAAHGRRVRMDALGWAAVWPKRCTASAGSQLAVRQTGSRPRRHDLWEIMTLGILDWPLDSDWRPCAKPRRRPSRCPAARAPSRQCRPYLPRGISSG